MIIDSDEMGWDKGYIIGSDRDLDNGFTEEEAETHLDSETKVRQPSSSPTDLLTTPTHLD